MLMSIIIWMLDAAEEIAVMKKFAMVTETVIMNQANIFISIICTKTIFHFTMKITKYILYIYYIYIEILAAFTYST